LPHFRTGLAIDTKAALFDPVTAADLAAGPRQGCACAPPAWHCRGGVRIDRADADYCWIIDPIDGTRAFIVGQPLGGR
jgi:myo-inositol-1(or 4)-monophosphatase